MQLVHGVVCWWGHSKSISTHPEKFGDRVVLHSLYSSRSALDSVVILGFYRLEVAAMPCDDRNPKQRENPQAPLS